MDGKFKYEENKLLEINFQNARCVYDTNMNRYVNKKKSNDKIDIFKSKSWGESLFASDVFSSVTSTFCVSSRFKNLVNIDIVIPPFYNTKKTKYDVTVMATGYDRYNALSSAQKWDEKYNTVQIRQHSDTLHPPTKLLYQLLMG